MGAASGAAGDGRLLTLAGVLRAVTTSVVGIALGVHLGRLGLGGESLGLVVSSGLAGAALAAVMATLFADRLGRRRFLMALAGLGALGGAAFAFASGPVALACAAFVGMLNGMGKDRGAALTVEQAALTHTTDDAGRTRTLAVYTMLQDLGHALGALLVGGAGWLAGRTAQVAAASAAAPGAHRATFLLCAAASLVGLLLYARLGPGVEVGASAERARLSARSRGLVARIAALFALDAVAGGFLTTAMLSYFFFERFGATDAVVGALFFGARLMNAASHLGAAWLARRIGLVNTMVFTHIPSSFLLVSVAYAPSFEIAAALFLLREGLVEMDVPTRQSYVLAVVEPHERLTASGLTNLVRLGGWAVAPAFAGLAMGGGSMHLPLIVGASMKVAYDLLLWRAFRAVRPPEERER